MGCWHPNFHNLPLSSAGATHWIWTNIQEQTGKTLSINQQLVTIIIQYSFLTHDLAAPDTPKTCITYIHNAHFLLPALYKITVFVNCHCNCAQNLNIVFFHLEAWTPLVLFIPDLTLFKHPLWIYRSRTECLYLQSYFSFQSTLKLSKFSILKEYSFLTFKIHC